MDQLEKMQELLHSKGQRMTVQKKALLDIFLRHPHRMLSVSDLKGLLPDGMEMDSATIYRNVTGFEVLGLLESMVDLSGSARYMICEHEHHHHLVCVCCGRILCFPCDNPFWRSFAEQNGFEETHHRIEIYGLCSGCKNKQS